MTIKDVTVDQIPLKEDTAGDVERKIYQLKGTNDWGYKVRMRQSAVSQHPYVSRSKTGQQMAIDP